MEDLDAIVVVVWQRIGIRGLEGYGEIVAKGINDDDYSFLERLGMPASTIDGARCIGIMKLNRRNGALRLVVENQTGEEEAIGEEVDADDVKNTI
jgi:hypothetical protein